MSLVRTRSTLPALPLAAGLAAVVALATGCSSSEEKYAYREVVAPPTPPFDELVVNGESIPEIVVRREQVYALGSVALESRKLELFIEEEIENQVEAGADRAKFEVSDDEVMEAVNSTIDQIKAQYPTEDVATVLASNKLDPESLARQVRQTRLFERVFLPENPNDWPASTVALMEGSGGAQLVDKLKESWALREEAGEDAPAANDQGMAMWKTILQKLVIQGLNRSAIVKTAVDGLPPEVCMTVNGAEVKTEDMYQRVKSMVSDEDLRRTRIWVAKNVAVRQALEKSGNYLNDEAYAAAYAEHEEPYKASPFPLEVLAMGFKKFPSMDAYKQYFRLLESFEKEIAEELSDEHLQEHMERANQMLGLAQVNCEVILISAFDFKRNRWMENGWERAAKRATEAAQKLADGGDWSAILEEYSDYWDPPAPANPQMQQPQQKKNKGRFGPLNRNELVQRVGESEYEMYLWGTSVTDEVFFNQEVGTLDGPFKGPHGYYITRVISRTRPTRPPLQLADENQRELILQDYLSVRFNEYAEEVLTQATVQGLPQG